MRTIRRSSSLMDRLPDPVREFLSRRAAELRARPAGADMAAIALALATWSVDDPSINNATSGAVKNWLGRPGAMVADLLMQLIGLGVIALLFPPIIWALRLIRFHLFDRGALKLGLWVVGIAATAPSPAPCPPRRAGRCPPAWAASSATACCSAPATSPASPAMRSAASSASSMPASRSSRHGRRRLRLRHRRGPDRRERG
jgi:hypothetical protein